MNQKDTPIDIAGMLEFPCEVQRLANGNTLITDAGDKTGIGSEIIEVDPAGKTVWLFDDGLHFAHSAERLPNGNTLITDTGNNRLLEVAQDGEILLDSGDWGCGTGKLSDGSHLEYPNDAHDVGGGRLLVTDRDNDRCILVRRDGDVLWSYDDSVKHPHNADMLENGNILLADSDKKRVIEVNPQKEIVWECGGEGIFEFPRDADRLQNGNTLITDSRNHRVIEVTPDGKTVWDYKVDYYACFYEADKLANGNVLISDQHHHRVFEVDAAGSTVWEFSNWKRWRKIHPEITNAAFETKDDDGLPTDWLLYNRFAEGGGRVIWDNANEPHPCPGLEYDRDGALCLFQYVAVEPGRMYKLSACLRSQEVGPDAVAFIQLFFLDSYDGAIENTAVAPRGRYFIGTNDWAMDSVEAVAPGNATSVEVRLFINGPGRVWVRDLSFQ